MLGTLILYTGGSVWLKKWSENNSKHGGNPEVGKYIGIYFAFGIGSAALVVMQTLILWIFCSIEVSPQSWVEVSHMTPRLDAWQTGPHGKYGTNAADTNAFAGLEKAP